jgi:hypothetical protein
LFYLKFVEMQLFVIIFFMHDLLSVVIRFSSDRVFSMIAFVFFPRTNFVHFFFKKILGTWRFGSLGSLLGLLGGLILLSLLTSL